MEAATALPTLIEKEYIPNLQFPHTEVLLDPLEREERRKRLERCTKLGNNYKGKVHIVFEDEDGIKEVYTTIWATTEHNIVLKRNAFIPIHRIHRVVMY